MPTSSTSTGETCVLTALVDITARVRAEAALRESERRFAQAFNANPLPMTITDREGRPLDVNEAALRHSGYTRDEWMARPGPAAGRDSGSTPRAGPATSR